MLSAYGWVIVRSSREKYQNASYEQIDALDDEIDKADEILWEELEDRLNKTANHCPLLRTQFTRHFNNVCGHLSILLSRNHSAPELLELVDWIAANAKGSYGIIYLRNDESEFQNQFRVIRINKGSYTEHDDPFLSPLYPVVEYENPFDTIQPEEITVDNQMADATR